MSKIGMNNVFGIRFKFEINPEGMMSVEDLTVNIGLPPGVARPSQDEQDKIQNQVGEWVLDQMTNMVEEFYLKFHGELHCMPEPTIEYGNAEVLEMEVEEP